MCSSSVTPVLTNTDHLLKTYEKCCVKPQREGLLTWSIAHKYLPTTHNSTYYRTLQE